MANSQTNFLIIQTHKKQQSLIITHLKKVETELFDSKRWNNEHEKPNVILILHLHDFKLI